MSHSQVALLLISLFVVLPLWGMLRSARKQELRQLRAPLMNRQWTVANLAKAHYLSRLSVYAHLTRECFAGRVKRTRDESKFPTPWYYTATDRGYRVYGENLHYEAAYTPESPLCETVPVVEVAS